MPSPQSTDRIYDPELSILERDGISLVSRAPETEDARALLFASALERGDVSKPLVIRTSPCAGLGLLYAKEGSPQLAFPSFVPSEQTVGKGSSPTEKKGFPVGKEGSPAGKESFPTEKEGSPAGQENSPIGKESSPIGKENFSVGKEIFSAEKGSFLLFDCGLPRKLTLPGPASYQILYFDGGGISYFRKRLFQKEPCLPVPLSLGLHSELSLLFEPEQMDDVCQHLLLTRLLSGMVMSGTPAPRKPPSYLLAIQKEFNEQYYRKHTLETLEEKYQINKYRICREFRHFFQTSPLQYLHRIRIQAAQDMLLKTDMKIYEISYEIGYESVNHFIHHFRKFTGMTPAEYRERL